MLLRCRLLGFDFIGCYVFILVVAMSLFKWLLCLYLSGCYVFIL
jgi:hypothetical protein